MSATMRWLLTPMALMAGLGLVLALAGDPRVFAWTAGVVQDARLTGAKK